MKLPNLLGPLDRFAHFRLTRELRGIREALEAIADAQRMSIGLTPKFDTLDPIEPEPSVQDRAQTIIGQNDYLTAHIIEELAAEANIRLTGAEDLEALAKDRGWVDDEGKFLMLPQSYGGGKVEAIE